MKTIPENKTCPGCGLTKQSAAFGKHSRDGLRSQCKICVKEKERAGDWSKGDIKKQARNYYKKNSQRLIQKTLNLRALNHDKHLTYQKNRGIRNPLLIS
jgi:hypothetical protein